MTKRVFVIDADAKGLPSPLRNFLPKSDRVDDRPDEIAEQLVRSTIAGLGGPYDSRS